MHGPKQYASISQSTASSVKKGRPYSDCCSAPVSISISQAACTVIKHMCRKDEPHNDRLVRLWLQGTVPDAISRMGASKCGHTCFLSFVHEALSVVDGAVDIHTKGLVLEDFTA